MSGIIAQNTLDNSGLIKAPAGGGAWNFIAKQTASASADISFTSGIDSTYKEYIFTFKNLHQATDVAQLTFQTSTDGGSSYGVTCTSTFFYSAHGESGGGTGVHYWDVRDLAQSTDFQILSEDAGNDTDENYAGYLHLFNPSSTTFVKHFMSTVQSTQRTNYSSIIRAAGYFNTTSAIDAVQFKISSGNIDAGDICLYGIST